MTGRVTAAGLLISGSTHRPQGGPLTLAKIEAEWPLLREYETKTIVAALNRLARRESPAAVALQLRTLAAQVEHGIR